MGKVIEFKEAKRKIRIRRLKKKVSSKINMKYTVIMSIIFISIAAFVFITGKDNVSKDVKMAENDIGFNEMLEYARYKH